MCSKFNKQIQRLNQSRLQEYRVRISKIEAELLELRTTISPSVKNSGNPVIFKSEFDFISSCILDYPNTETGGQLFGYWTAGGTPIVLYAIGPGRNANHQRTFFNQDVDYLVNVGHELKARFGICHIGEWHSHHKLGLARPSGHDVNTMISTIREKNLGHFLLCIGNCDGNRSTLSSFICDDKSCSPSEWDIIKGESPIRNQADRQLGSILLHPVSSPCYIGRTIEGDLVSPGYPSDYFLGEKWGREEFKSYIDYISTHFLKYVQRVSPKIDANGLAHLLIYAQDKGKRITEDILFPAGYPLEGPIASMTVDGLPVKLREVTWDKRVEPYYAFVKFYSHAVPFEYDEVTIG